MIVVRIAKCRPSDVLTTYLRDLVSALHYGHAITYTPRALANTLNAVCDAKTNLQGTHHHTYHTINDVRNYPSILQPTPGICLRQVVAIPTMDHAVTQLGYRAARMHNVGKSLYKLSQGNSHPRSVSVKSSSVSFHSNEGSIQ